jgi:hypothetical protein
MFYKKECRITSLEDMNEGAFLWKIRVFILYFVQKKIKHIALQAVSS